MTIGNTLKRASAVIIAALFILCTAVSCYEKNKEEDTEDTVSSALVSSRTDLSEYTIVRSDTATKPVVEAAVKLRKAINKKFGCDISITTDFVKNESDIPLSAKEILIGSTNRRASADAASGLSGYDSAIKTDGDFIVITGASDIGTIIAADTFIEDYLGKEESNNNNMTEIKDMIKRMDIIDNSSLIPPLLPDNEVKLVPAEPGGEALWPEWINDIIVTEVHIETCAEDGTFKTMGPVLDYIQNMGVNCIWLSPIYQKTPGGNNGYGNYGAHTIDPVLTGTNDPDAGWEVVRRFVEDAHSRGIRVLLDVITWGTTFDSPLMAEHPDWYKGEAWGGAAFDWSNEDLKDWFVGTCVENIMKTGADGFRCDCEPVYTGYGVFSRIRQGCLDRGRKILIFAEDGAERRTDYAFELDGVMPYGEWSRGQQYAAPKQFLLEDLDIVDAIKSGSSHGARHLQDAGKGGRYTYYVFCVSNHDYQYSSVNGRPDVIGYQAILAPYIPLWYLGGEMGMREDASVIFFTELDWDLLKYPENALLLEDVKKMIRIRRSYPEIFSYWPADHRDSNICSVDANGTWHAYARYAPDGGKAVIVAANHSDSPLKTTVSVPFAAAGMNENAGWVITDLMNGGTKDLNGKTFGGTIPPYGVGVYLVSGK